MLTSERNDRNITMTCVRETLTALYRAGRL